MTRKRSYPIVCPSCDGTGRIPEIGISSNSTRECLACKGSGFVIVTEDINGVCKNCPGKVIDKRRRG